MLQINAKLTAEDPVYQPEGEKKNCFAKMYPLKLKARQFYIIEMAGGASGFEPFLYLEGSDGKILATNDSGGSGNACVFFQPLRSGDYCIIATTYARASGDFKLTVRTSAKGKE